jgi:hypothetical protein
MCFLSILNISQPKQGSRFIVVNLQPDDSSDKSVHFGIGHLNTTSYKNDESVK